MSRGILLFAHGARDPQWADPFKRIRDQVREASPGVRVELSFLEMMTPSLKDMAAEMVAQGVDTLTIVPLFMAQGSHLKQDLPEIMEELKRTHSGVEIQLTPAIGDVPALTAAIARWIIEL